MVKQSQPAARYEHDTPEVPSLFDESLAYVNAAHGSSLTCPLRSSGSIRSLKVREERVLADRKLTKSGSIVDERLRACWEEPSNPNRTP